MEKYVCHVCGYPNLEEPPWVMNGKIPSHNICDCCGVEFGYEDCTKESIKRFRCEWIKKGCKWFSGELKPDNWNYQEQLQNITYKVKKNVTIRK
ncbi:hypothetical protein CF065_07910 [Clostridium sporogenes]|uniref:hypothetical protein n=1 Tax=Clostridium sporogenes TaxID=1509 RepID=UPI002237F6CB|nr:hypothetical protein [Clostridium sporogenes]MCW6076133.1 hypothetical protein [Clostridium sporogenes]MCW6111064.1 hypothetical protein [Clostridium sporogenes]